MNSSRRLLPALLMLLPAYCGAAEITIDLRSRVEAFKGKAEWSEVRLQKTIATGATAVLICDMWDKHWCSGATGRVNGLVGKMDAFVAAARRQGIQIIHAPSETMGFYQDAPQRKRMLALPTIEFPAPVALTDPPLPIDDSAGGCDTPDKFYKAWTREHPGLHIEAMGVHTNMCVLNRTFAIKKMTALGIRCILVRDLTDAMYNPGDAPHVSHEAGTQLVIEYIEKFWAPTTTSAELLRAFRR
jgi:nicotinamidase-related amidase